MGAEPVMHGNCRNRAFLNVTYSPPFCAASKPMIYGYLRTSRAAVDGLADASVELANIFQDMGSSGSVLVSDRPGWTELDAKIILGDTVTVAALDRSSRNRLDMVGVVESLQRLGVGIASPGSIGSSPTLPRSSR